MPDLSPPNGTPSIQQPAKGDVDRAIEALDSVRRQWLRRPEVGAVDVGFRVKNGALQLEEGPVVRVHLEQKRDRDALQRWEIFPDHVPGFEDVKVDVIEAVYGFSTAPEEGSGDDGDDREDDPRNPAALLRRSRVAPLMGGVSVGNPRVTAGTLGAVVWRNEDGLPHILSNWHVLAGSEGKGCCCGTSGGRSSGQPHYQSLSGAEPHYQSLAGLQPHYQALAGLQPHYQALAGLQPHYQFLAGVEPHYQSASSGQPHYQAAAVYEPIYQPGRFDGGAAVDTVARLVDLRLDRYMDAALARLEGDRPYTAEIWGVGRITGVEEEPQLGTVVVKSGRSTALTWGLIDGVSVSTKIEFEQGERWFEDQLHIVPVPRKDGRLDGVVSEDGDSGSVWVDVKTGRAVGLHFAGDKDQGISEHALANRMSRVAEELDFSFEPTLAAVPPSPVWVAPPWPSPPSEAKPASAGDEALERARRIIELASHLLR